ncbi:Fur family transcriptional regulator [Sediminispirochaeta smaragdinae]|uniref:Ferric uptake regulator, Fur family n=1 Tax=Sediminispirochaeta smaragdinae (strain DSM 11293 / JCM 15392 / SEBR 4228) TaxID=573413 RepID=E1RAB3_SEDSS|nr:Fur family transcriptional regulator [Sediminispirochaeta smaragdinae]ADK79404.1 ferric uptake regulator, Fur family [Sediminispirochaeta smaragdinae DSM 11293]
MDYSSRGYGRGFGRGCSRAEGPFQRKGVRMTLTRRVIIEALDRADGYLSAEELFLIVREEYPGIGVATIYRTLQLLEELALVQRVETGEGRARYAMSRDKDAGEAGVGNEVVLICDRCGKVIRQPKAAARCSELFDSLSRKAEENYRFHTERQVLQIHGLCAGCTGAPSEKSR